MRRLPILLVFLLTPSWAWAHNVLVDCKLRGDKVEVEAFYDDNTAAAKAKVHVEDAAKEEIAKGVTDAQGNWNFPTPKPGQYVVYVDAGAGHRAKKDFVVTGPAPGEESIANELISDGPTREKFTQAKWWKAGLGLVVIAGLSGAFLIASMLRKNGRSPDPPAS